MASDRILEDFGRDLIEDLQESLRKKKVTFGGGDSKLSAKIRYLITEDVNGVHFKLMMPEYGEYLDKGRRKTSKTEGGKVFPAIMDWVKRKGIVGKSKFYTESKKKGKDRFTEAQKQLAFVISRKIHRSGYKGNKFYTSVLADGRLDKLTKDLTEFYKKRVTVEIADILIKD